MNTNVKLNLLHDSAVSNLQQIRSLTDSIHQTPEVRKLRTLRINEAISEIESLVKFANIKPNSVVCKNVMKIVTQYKIALKASVDSK